MANHRYPRASSKAAPLLGMLLLLILSTSTTDARSLFSGRIIATVPPKNNPGEEKNTPKPPVLTKPPPPPPPSEKGKIVNTKTAPPPPPPKLQEKAPVNEEVQTQAAPPVEAEQVVNLQAGTVEFKSQEWENPSAQWESSSAWGQYPQDPQQQQQPYYHESYGYQQPDGSWLSIEQQLANSVGREHELLDHVQNLTETINSMQQLDILHTRQMDVLTERIMAAEAQIAVEQNRALEYQANCTDLARNMAVLHDELTEWQSRCANFAEQNEKNEERIKDLKRELTEARASAENLAISIENSRIRNQLDGSRRKKKKSKSLLGWIWSFFVSSDDEDDFDDVQSPTELAKSTLLKALQVERNNVDELEAVVASLQRNNSAIAEVVKSRDTIVEELNNRVDVFEEDKVVLKAALKQLQKEMKEEAPRTEKLIDDLEVARQDNARLMNEIESLVDMHQNELTVLQQSIVEAQHAANASESNLTAIGQYVDTLEERLASFAIVRRDVEMREQKCKEIEERGQLLEEERDSLRTKVEEFEVEQSDLKSLFEELVQEQSKLREESALLKQEKDALSEGAQRSREVLAALENKLKNQEGEISEWELKVQKLEDELNSTKSERAALQEEMAKAQTSSNDMTEQIEAANSRVTELEAKLEATMKEMSQGKDLMEAKLSELSEKEELVASTAESLQKSEKEREEYLSKLQQREEEIKKLGEELTKLKSSSQGSEGSLKQKSDSAGKGEDKVQRDQKLKAKDDKSKPSLPAPGAPGSKNARGPAAAQEKSRSVPFRKTRKLFAKLTGVHGAFTAPSKKVPAKKPPARPLKSGKGPVSNAQNPPQRVPPWQKPKPQNEGASSGGPRLPPPPPKPEAPQ